MNTNTQSPVRTTLLGSQGDDILVPTGNGNTYRGLGGDDTYIISPSIVSPNAHIQIDDTAGFNKIQLADGLSIASSLFYEDQVDLTLSNGAVISILGADTFRYELGANATANDASSNPASNFQGFAAAFGATLPAVGSNGSSIGTLNGVVSATGSIVVPDVTHDAFQTSESGDIGNLIANNVAQNPNAASGLRDGVDGNILWTKTKVPSGKKKVDGLLISKNSTQNAQWETSLVDEKTEISYSFANTPPKYGPAYDSLGALKASFIPLNDTQQQLARATLAQWGEIVPLSFAEREEPDSVGDIRWFGSNAGQQIGTASALAPTDALAAAAGDIWIGPNYPEQYNDPVPGGYGYQTFLHELGHILGLIHPQDAVTPIDSEHDQLRYTVMSYRDFAGDDLNGYDAKRFFPTTPMLDDISALQYLYGANWDYHKESNTYSWPANKPVFETVWDGGGAEDTFDASNQTEAVIFNLNPGEWSSIGLAFWDGQAMVRNGLTIAYGVEIENAIGSDHDDTLIGNSLPNTFEGGKGNDTILGGGGVDVAIFDGVRTGYQWSVDKRKVIIRDIDPGDGDDGVDVLVNVEKLRFKDVDVTVPLTDDNGTVSITKTMLLDTALPGTTQANGASYSAIFSPDDHWLAFTSDANNLIADDKNNVSDIFVKNLATNQLILVDSAKDGIQGNWGARPDMHFSPDGQLLAFTSGSSNLVENDTNNALDIFIKNWQTGEINLVSRAINGTQANGLSIAPVFSIDGRMIAFHSLASNLLATDNNNVQDLFIKDLTTNEVSILNCAQDGTLGNGPTSDEPCAFSPDGQWVAFASAASNLVEGDDNANNDIFIKNLLTGEVRLVSCTQEQAGANGSSFAPSFSPDGEWLAFTSAASNLVVDDNNGKPDVFLKNLKTGEIKSPTVNGNFSVFPEGSGNTLSTFSPDGQWLTVTTYPFVLGSTTISSSVFLINTITFEYKPISFGANLYNYQTIITNPAFSPDGSQLAFHSDINSLVSNDNNNQCDIFLKDLNTNEITLASAAMDGVMANGISAIPVFDPTGQWIAYSSSASNLVAGDNNTTADVFITNLTSKNTQLISHAQDNAMRDGNSIYPAFSADGRWLSFSSLATNLVDGDVNGQLDAFILDRQTGNIEILNQNTDGIIGNGQSMPVSFSNDGLWVLFGTTSSNLTPESNKIGYKLFIKNLISHEMTQITYDDSKSTFMPFFDPTGHWLIFSSIGGKNIYSKNLQTGEINTVNSAMDGSVGNQYLSAIPWISCSPDGQWLCFSSWDTNLVNGDTNNRADVFIKNLSTGEIKLVSTTETGTLANGPSHGGNFSPDGKWILFYSMATNLLTNHESGILGAGDTRLYDLQYLKNLETGQIIKLNSAMDGMWGNSSIIFDVTQAKNPLATPMQKQGFEFSPNDAENPHDQWIAFKSLASNLVRGDNNGEADVFIKNLNTGDIQLLYSSGGQQANRDSGNIDFKFSPDGQAVVFASTAYNLVVGDTNGVADVFIKDLNSGSVQRIVEGHGESFENFVFSPDGEYISYIGGGHLYITPNPYWLG